MCKAFGVLLVVGLALTALAPSGCKRRASTPGSGKAPFQLDSAGFDLAPGAAREVTVTHGKARDVETKDKDVTAMLDGDKVTIVAAASARGEHVVRVTDIEGRSADVTVTVKRPRKK